MSRLIKILIGLLVLLIIFLMGGFFYLKFQIYSPLTNQADFKQIKIEKGQGLKEIAFQLEKEGLIRKDLWLIAYVVYQGWADQLKTGQYQLSPSMNIPQIAQALKEGSGLSDIKITIPEGFTLKQIDARLAQAGLIEKGQLAAQPQLQGYLFPDTYRFRPGSSLEEIIQKMKDNFEKKLSPLREEIAKQGQTLDQIITMASLLEKEVVSDQDRRLVAGIFWKRLRENYPLESCATIAYILNLDKWRYSFEDTRIDSPYNTYLHPGLPPGPINNPGLSAIKAALYPLKSDYNFFLSTPDGQTIYSRTLEEHNRNKAKYLK